MRGLLKGLLILMLMVGSAHADARRDAREVEILVTALSEVEGNGDLAKIILGKLRSEFGDCKASQLQDAAFQTRCFRFIMSAAVERAHKQGRLDRVEKTVLSRVFSIATVNGDEVKIDGEQDAGVRGGRGAINQPNVFEYRQRKAQFVALRRAKGQAEALDSKTAALVEKAYFRKMKDAGYLWAAGVQIGAEEYMASRYTRLQLNTLAQLLTTLVDRMNHSSGRVVLDRPDFASGTIRAETLEFEVMDLVAELRDADASEAPAIRARLARKREELERARTGLRADRIFVQLQLKKEERDRAIASLLEEGIADGERRTRAEAVEALERDVQELNERLGQERREIALAPSDVDKLAVKALQIELRRMAIQRGPWQGAQIEFGDVVMAGWIAGEVDAELLRAVLEMDALGEPRESLIRKIAGRAWRIGQTVALAYPATAYGVTIASIIMGSIEQAKERKKQETNDASLVR